MENFEPFSQQNGSDSYQPVGHQPSARPSFFRRHRRLVLFTATLSLAVFAAYAVMGNAQWRTGNFTADTRLFATGNSCKPVTTQANFDLDSFISKPWYIQQQMEISYQPASQLYCVEATYAKKDKPDIWGHSIQVRNYAREADGTVRDTKDFLCAAEQGAGLPPSLGSDDPAKLQVGPCFLPQIPYLTVGPYWIIAYNEEEGYALISGGQPTIKTKDGCRTGSGTNGSGLWIFTRERARNEALVQKVRGIAAEQGYDLSVLLDVDQTNCWRDKGPCDTTA